MYNSIFKFQFSFSSLASLNGVHMYGKSHNMLLKSTSTEDMTIVWKEFENRYVIIYSKILKTQWFCKSQENLKNHF